MKYSQVLNIVVALRYTYTTLNISYLASLMKEDGRFLNLFCYRTSVVGKRGTVQTIIHTVEKYWACSLVCARKKLARHFVPGLLLSTYRQSTRTEFNCNQEIAGGKRGENGERLWGWGARTAHQIARVNVIYER